MQRRDLLTAAPVAGFAALAAQMVEAAGDTPVMQAYREWKAFSNWLNSAATRGMDEEEVATQTDILSEHVMRVVNAPSQSDRDVVVKFLTVTEDYQLLHGIEELQPLTGEARALIGGAA